MSTELILFQYKENGNIRTRVRIPGRSPADLARRPWILAKQIKPYTPGTDGMGRPMGQVASDGSNLHSHEKKRELSLVL